MRNTDCTIPSGCARPVPCPPAPCSPTPCQPQGGFLMQQIVGSGRAFIRYECFHLLMQDLPCDARQPLKLMSVSVREGPIPVSRCDDPCDRWPVLMAHIPLCCTVQDACGCCFTAASGIDVPVRMRLCGTRGTEHASTAVTAWIRMARPCCCDGTAFEARLDGCVEAWLTACRPMYTENCPPSCPPPLPLYPR